MLLRTSKLHPYSKTILHLIGSEETLSKVGRDEDDYCIIRRRVSCHFWSTSNNVDGKGEDHITTQDLPVNSDPFYWKIINGMILNIIHTCWMVFNTLWMCVAKHVRVDRRTALGYTVDLITSILISEQVKSLRTRASLAFASPVTLLLSVPAWTCTPPGRWWPQASAPAATGRRRPTSGSGARRRCSPSTSSAWASSRSECRPSPSPSLWAYWRTNPSSWLSALSNPLVVCMLCI